MAKTSSQKTIPAGNNNRQTFNASNKSNSSVIKLFDSEYQWADKDEVLDAAHWLKQILAIFIGIIWGFLGFTGILGVVFAISVHSIATYALMNRVNYDFDPDEMTEVVKENFMQSFSAFLASWIVVYTAANFKYL